MAKPRTPAPTTWGQELSAKYNSGIMHAFLLHGNVGDYVAGVSGQSLRNFLMASFSKRECVVYWNRATGFLFAKPAMKRVFAEMAGLTTAQARPQQNAARGLGAALNTASTGADPLALVDQAGRQPSAALGLIDQALRAQPDPQSNRSENAYSSANYRGDAGDAERRAPRLAVIIDYVESIVPQVDADARPEDRQALVTMCEWGKDASFGQREHIIILIASALHDVNERIRRSGARWEQLEIPFPSLTERREFAQGLLEDKEIGASLGDSFSLDELARLTTGLRYIDVEDIVLRASYSQKPITSALVKTRKDEIVSSEFEEVLQVIEPDQGFESLGGMTEIKEYLREDVVEPMRSGDHRRVPMGILLMGPAGVGKTRLAKALAREAGVTFVELQPSKIYSKWVGDTERRLERALTAIRMMTPCVVFVDEIDQAMQRGESGDSGVSNRVFKRLMEVMSDTTMRGKIVWLAATNRPDLLDAAFRVGRIDKNIPILAPSPAERADILRVLTQQAFGTKGLPTKEEYRQLADLMEGYTGAELEVIVGKAVALRAKHSDWSILQALQEAYERIIPSTQDVERMTQLALANCNDLDLVPSQWRDMARRLRRQGLLVDEQAGSEIQPTHRRKREL